MSGVLCDKAMRQWPWGCWGPFGSDEDGQDQNKYGRRTAYDSRFRQKVREQIEVIGTGSSVEGF